MMIHPPMLYSGYTLFAVPFAFAVGALITRRLDAEWIRATRPFALAAWFFLGIGILLGARWSYSELGWGGYWAWDPVENASLMPWLTGTAFLHSVMIQEKRGMLKVWNVSLVLATGVLAILGTFLVRSGILDSIHAFGASTLGVPFLVADRGDDRRLDRARRLARAPTLRSEHRLDSLLSREAVFLLNNLVLVGALLRVFWGTFFPLISEAVTGDEASVGPPWFDRYIVPLALVLVLLSGIGPVIAWRRATRGQPAAQLRAARAAAALVVLVAAARARRDRPSRRRCSCSRSPRSCSAAVGQEFVARRARAAGDVAASRCRARWSRSCAATAAATAATSCTSGIAVLFVGVAASSAFQHARDVALRPGQTRDGRRLRRHATCGRRRGIAAARTARLERIDLGARAARARGDGKTVDTLRTERSYFPSQRRRRSAPVSRFFEGEATSEVGLRGRPAPRHLDARSRPTSARCGRSIEQGDKVFATRRRRCPPTQRGAFLGAGAAPGSSRATATTPPPATFRLLVSPLVTWIWLGALIVFAGGLIALWPAPARARAPVRAGYAARVARELGRA